MANKTQSQRILDYIDRYGSITQREAYIDLGIMRLARRISELNKAGHHIVGEFERSTNRLGEPIIYKRYRYAEEENNGQTLKTGA